MSALTSSDVASLKHQLKAWEKAFRQREGRDPEKSDMKADKDIADKYAAYNLARTGGRTAPSKKASSSGPAARRTAPSGPGREAPTTPQKVTSSQTSARAKAPAAAPPHGAGAGAGAGAAGSKPASTTVYAHANSPSKLRQLIAARSPRKSTSRATGGATTVSPSLDDGFDDLSGAGGNPFVVGPTTPSKSQRSPGLFGALVDEREAAKRREKKADETPRTRARRFLGEGGSPLKKSTTRLRDPSEGLDDDTVMSDVVQAPGKSARGLGGFLRSNSTMAPLAQDGVKTNGQAATAPLSQPIKSHSPISGAVDQAMHDSEPWDDHNNAGEDVLGPSPFKPRPATIEAFQFDSDSSDDGGEGAIAPGLASVFPISPVKKSRGGLFAVDGGAQRSKKGLFGADLQGPGKTKQGGAGRKGNDDDFYADLEGKTEEEVAAALKGGLPTKKGKAAATRKKNHPADTDAKKPLAKGKGGAKGNKAAASTSRPSKRARLETEADDVDEAVSDDSLSRLPALPNRANDASYVVAELDVYEFEPDGRLELPGDTKSQKGPHGAKGKGKGKAATEVIEPGKEKVVGKSKVVIGRYRPFDVVAKGTNGSNANDPEEATFDDSSDGEGAALRELRRKQQLLEDLAAAAHAAEDQEDIVVSEELMDLLSIQGSPSKTSRLRAKDHIERVRRLLGDQAAEQKELAKRKGLEDLEDDDVTRQKERDDWDDLAGGERGEKDAGSGDDDWQSETDGWKDVEDGLLMDDRDKL